jgi:hypothetical protein
VSCAWPCGCSIHVGSASSSPSQLLLFASCVMMSSHIHLFVRTQFLLKQSWAQKKLSLIPSFKHVGHCSAPASLSQSAPRHFFLAGGSAAMVMEYRDVECKLKA